VKNLTAPEAARHFAAVLDAVEHQHETFIVTRGGRAIASIGPAGGGGGRRRKTVLMKHRPVAAWRGELGAIREARMTSRWPR